MAIPSLDTLNISDERKKYIVDSLNPLLEKFITKCLTELPSDPMGAMLLFAGGDSLKQEIEALKKENQQLKGAVAEAAKMGGASTAPGAQKDEEEEEEEDDVELEEEPEFFKKPAGTQMRTSVSAEAYGAWNQKKAFTPPSYPKSGEQKTRLSDVLSKSFLFSSLEGKELDQVIDAMQEVKATPKQRLINQGDDGDFLFVIEQGILDCYKLVDGAEKVVKTCQVGDAFGELALLYNCPRAASVEAREACVLWKLDRETFNHIVKEAAGKKREKHEAFLKQVPLLSSMDAYERSQVADALCRETYSSGKQVCVEDADGDKFFIIEEGEAYAEKKDVGKVMDYKPGDYFGELALLRNQPRAATVTAKSDLTVLTLGRTAFKRLLGPLDDLLSRGSSKYS